MIANNCPLSIFSFDVVLRCSAKPYIKHCAFLSASSIIQKSLCGSKQCHYLHRGIGNIHLRTGPYIWLLCHCCCMKGAVVF